MDMLLGCLQKSCKLLCNGDTVNDIFLLLMIYDCFYEHTAFFYWYINFHTVIIAHFCTGAGSSTLDEPSLSPPFGQALPASELTVQRGSLLRCGCSYGYTATAGVCRGPARSDWPGPPRHYFLLSAARPSAGPTAFFRHCGSG